MAAIRTSADVRDPYTKLASANPVAPKPMPSIRVVVLPAAGDRLRREK